MYDKEFQNFLINLDKEKSHSEKMRVNQAYGIYHDIVESEDKFCFIIDDSDKSKLDSVLRLLSAIKDTEEYVDTDSVTPETRKSVIKINQTPIMEK